MVSRSKLWLIPLALLCHNIEEAIGMWTFLPIDPATLPLLPVSLPPTITYGPFLLALIVVTALPFVLLAAHRRERAQQVALFALLALASALLLNVVWHVGWSFVFQGYTPGVVTAILVLLPAVAHVLWCAWRERWFQERVLWALPIAAVLLHGPALFGLLAGSRWVLAHLG